MKNLFLSLVFLLFYFLNIVTLYLGTTRGDASNVDTGFSNVSCFEKISPMYVLLINFIKYVSFEKLRYLTIKTNNPR